MKKLLYISFLIMLALGCNNLKSISFSKENTIITDTITEKNDTITKISNPFKINGIECYWKYSIFEGERIMVLRDYKIDRVLLDYSGYRAYSDWDYKSEDYFDEFNKDIFIDVNFDGFKDFVFQNIGSMPMNDSVEIRIFNNQTKTFEETTDDDILYAQHIMEIDSINKKLIMSNDYRFGTDSIVHSFDDFGKIKSTEVFSEYEEKIDTIWTPLKKYQKIINGVIIETKTDSIIQKWE